MTSTAEEPRVIVASSNSDGPPMPLLPQLLPLLPRPNDISNNAHCAIIIATAAATFAMTMIASDESSNGS